MTVRWSAEQLENHLHAAGNPSPVNAEKTRVEQHVTTAKGVARETGLNKLESDYADVLEARRVAGEIRWWRAHPIALRLADKTFYHPDFLVMSVDGELSVRETKGFMRDDANVKLKVAAAMFPFRFYLVRKKAKKDGGGFSEDEV